MNISSNVSSNRVRERVLDLVWRQWIAIGVPGYTRSEETRVVDPEALLVLTLTVGLHDARLYDEVVAWLQRNGDLINVQRLRGLLPQSPPEATAAMSAVAEILGDKSTSAPKWKQLAALPGLDVATSLFYQLDGRPMPRPPVCDDVFQLRGLLRPPLPGATASGPFPRDGAPALLLRLRALLGVSLRCEILCLLGGNDELHPSRMATLIGTAPRTMQKLLNEMARSGFVQVRTQAREKYYSLVPGALDGLLLADAGLGQTMRDDKAHPGESYLRVFQEDVEGLLAGL